MSVSRRRILKGVFATVAWAASHPMAVFADNNAKTSRARFPQGIASGDPTPNSVVLWTRAEPDQGAVREYDKGISLQLQVAADKGFTSVVLDESVNAEPSADHTVRVVVKNLKAARTYYYRFVDDGGRKSPLGRTFTAPDPGADVPVRFAVTSCQNYQTGYFRAYQHLLQEDSLVAPGEGVQFILHLGDFIYETVFDNQPRHVNAMLENEWQQDDVTYAWSMKIKPATTLLDYRSLYKGYLEDPYLRAARANWPFISLWDDHEFTNDCWQSYTTYRGEDIPSPHRKVAANQAWFEYIPVMLDELEGDQIAQNFRPTSFSGKHDREPGEEDNLLNEEALASINIGRHLHWGSNLHLIIPDARSFRSRHPVPQDFALKIGPHPRALLPSAVVEAFDAEWDVDSAGSEQDIVYGDKTYLGADVQSEAGSMLGQRQKDWFKRVLVNDTARWQVWANSVPFLPLKIDYDLLSRPHRRGDYVFSSDSWDGFPAERQELSEFIQKSGVANVVSLAGDYHISYTGYIENQTREKRTEKVGIEFGVPAISSTTLFSMFSGIADSVTDEPGVAAWVHGKHQNATENREPWFNVSLFYGADTATNCLLSDRNPSRSMLPDKSSVNPHLRFLETSMNGYGLVEVTSEQFTYDLVLFSHEQLQKPYSKTSAPDARFAFSVDSWADIKQPVINQKESRGSLPLPYGWPEFVNTGKKT